MSQTKALESLLTVWISNCNITGAVTKEAAFQSYEVQIESE